MPWLLTAFDQPRKPRLDFLAQMEPHAEFPLNLPSPVEEQQSGQVLDVVAPSEFSSDRAAEVHMEELDSLAPLSFEPMHDGTRRLAAESEIRVEV
jgi:hypothetical protein